MKTGKANPKVIVALLLIVVIAYLAVWKPHAATLADVKANNVALAQQLATLNAAAAVRVPTTAAIGTPVLELAIPSTPELPSLLRQLQRIAVEAGVTQGSVGTAPAAATGGAPGASMAVTIAVTGPKLAVYDYVRRLSTLQRLFVVDGVNEVPAAGTDPAAAVVDSVALGITGRVFSTSTVSAGSSG